MSELININSATAEELTALPGVGPAMADRIVAARPFEMIDDLRLISGVGPALLERWTPLITLTDPAPAEDVILVPMESETELESGEASAEAESHPETEPAPPLPEMNPSPRGMDLSPNPKSQNLRSQCPGKNRSFQCHPKKLKKSKRLLTPNPSPGTRHSG